MIDCKKILWENVSLLMHQHYGKENLTQCADDSGVGPGTMSRIKAQETSVGIDTIEKLATLFNVQPYELMIPNLSNQEVSVVKSMRVMKPGQRSDFVKISLTLAQPNGDDGDAQKHAAQ
ncbi:MAG: hypothetical protein A2V79_05480 [Betaproteobacteria bacterium RBG_16_56_24]|nr:MAG: hypothetical protein A2V79_05480 [Betaproteobacteria bacterium RBG_16_56_24]